MRFLSFFFFLTTLCGLVFLYIVSYQVAHVERDVRMRQQAIVRSKDNLRALKAEWAYMQAPQRLERLAHFYLRDLQPTTPQQLATLKTLFLQRVNLLTTPTLKMPEVTPPKQKSLLPTADVQNTQAQQIQDQKTQARQAQDQSEKERSTHISLNKKTQR